MNHIERKLSELIEENGGTVVSVRPQFIFRGSHIVVGMVGYRFNAIALDGGQYRVFGIPELVADITMRGITFDSDVTTWDAGTHTMDEN